MSKSVLVVYSCYNPPTSLIDSIQSIYDKIEGYDIKIKIMNGELINMLMIIFLIMIFTFAYKIQLFSKKILKLIW